MSKLPKISSNEDAKVNRGGIELQPRRHADMSRYHSIKPLSDYSALLDEPRDSTAIYMYEVFLGWLLLACEMEARLRRLASSMGPSFIWWGIRLPQSLVFPPKTSRITSLGKPQLQCYGASPCDAKRLRYQPLRWWRGMISYSSNLIRIRLTLHIQPLNCSRLLQQAAAAARLSLAGNRPEAEQVLCTHILTSIATSLHFLTQTLKGLPKENSIILNPRSASYDTLNHWSSEHNESSYLGTFGGMCCYTSRG